MSEQQDPSSHSGRDPVDPMPQSPPPPPPYAPPVAYAPQQPSGSGWGKRVVRTLLILSLVLNGYLLLYVVLPMFQKRDSVMQEGDAKQTIAVIPIDGIITDDTAGFVRYALDRCRTLEPRAIVLRVNSPGGNPWACDRIVHMLRSYRQEHNTPIVASFGGVAASGGYYVAAAADQITAEPLCVTGSIGVIGQVFLMPELMEKIGVTPRTFVAPGSDLKDVANNTFRQWNEQDEQVVNHQLAMLHERFITVVAEGRQNLDVESLRPLARGQTFFTSEAKAAGLVDTEGYLDDAIVTAGKLAQVPQDVTPRVVLVTPPMGLLDMVMGISGSQRQLPVSGSNLPISGEQIRQWVTELSTPRLEYRWDPMVAPHAMPSR